MTLNQMFDFTPVYIYIVAAVQLFIGFSLSFAIGQILPLRIREFMYYLLVFFFYLFLFYMKLQQPMYSLEWEAFFLPRSSHHNFLFTKESFLKIIAVFYPGFLWWYLRDCYLFSLLERNLRKNYSVFTIPRILMFLIKSIYYTYFLFTCCPCRNSI